MNGAADLGVETIRHLGAQIESARRLLDLILRQGANIRRRDVDAVVRGLVDVKVEVGRRETLELQRSALLDQAGTALGFGASQVTLEHMCQLMAPGHAERARELSAALRKLLARIGDQNRLNRDLMRQELTFLDHLLRLAGQPDEPSYKPTGPAAPVRDRLLDLRA